MGGKKCSVDKSDLPRVFFECDRSVEDELQKKITAVNLFDERLNVFLIFFLFYFLPCQQCCQDPVKSNQLFQTGTCQKLLLP